MARRYPQPEFIASGKLIARLTHSLARVKDWSMEETMSYIGEQTRRSSDLVYRLQQGRVLPKAETVEVLAQIGYSEADLSREWCEEFLLATRYPDVTNLLNKLWGAKPLRTILCRLPHLEHTRLIGRQDEMRRLQELLSPRHAAYIITVDGMSGVGKTALVLDVAYHIWRASIGEAVAPHLPTFDAILFVSAKQQYLTAQGLFDSTLASRTLGKIFQEIALVLGRDDIRSAPVQEQRSLIREALGRQRTLLIVDNLETMEDKRELLSFLYELPPTVKSVVTTRERTMFSPIRLEQLAQEAALELVEQQAEEKQVSLGKREASLLYRRIGGIPAALVYAVGQLAAGYSVETVLAHVSRADGDVARFCFQGSVEPLRGKPAHAMLMAFALFPQMPSRSAVSYVAGLETDPITPEEALSQLQRLSLVREFQDRFRMLPLTREYALAELASHADFELEARERWIEWYLRLAKRYGGHDMQEWHVRFDELESEWENLLAVFDWCANQKRYDVMKAFWGDEEDASVVDFTTIYGLWDDSLNWQQWLMRAAEEREDWGTVLDTVASAAKTLMFMSRYDEAQDLFKQGQRLYPSADPQVQVRFLINQAYLHILLSHFEQASRLLDQARAVVPQLREPLRTRATVEIDYDCAVIQYWSGESAAAKTAFTHAMAQANRFGWQSLANAAQNFLADIAVNQDDYDEAERLLMPGLTMAERNNDKRSTTNYKRSLATLCQKQGRLDDARVWAREAQEGFEHLGMRVEAGKMSDLLQTLDTLVH